MRTGADNSDPQLARVLSRVLLLGLCIAVALLLVGVVLTVVRPDIPGSGENSLRDMPRALVALEPAGFFSLGLLILLATPAARVVAMLVAYVRRKTWLFSGLALLVLIVIATSAYLGLRAW